MIETDRFTLELEDARMRANRVFTDAGLPVPAAPVAPTPQVPNGVALDAWVHLTGLSPLWHGRLESYGDETLIRAADLPQLADQNGRCALLEYLADPALQVQRFGRVVLRYGRWPEGTPRDAPGSDRWWDRRAAAYALARTLPTPDSRKAALEAALATFGPAAGPPPLAVVRKAYGLRDLAEL